MSSDNKSGKVRVVQSPIDFRFYVEEETPLPTGGPAWALIEGLSSFPDIPAAHQWFQRAKKVRKAIPADLGDWND